VENPDPPPQEAQPWTYLEEHLWHTCDILADLTDGTLHNRPPVATRARLDPGERVLAVGWAQRLTWRALGNGSYAHNNVVAFGNPAFVIGSMLGSAVGNASRRNAAAAAAQPRWVLEGVGELTVTDRGAYFDHPRADAALWWTGNALDIDLIGPEDFQITFINVQGNRHSLRLLTPWASLLFVLAAKANFTAHPRLLGGTWLPPDFEDRCARAGRPCRRPFAPDDGLQESDMRFRHP
jgi:hypothetical protein